MFVSPAMSVIFSLYSAMFMITVALPLSAGSMMMELSFFSFCRATLSPLLMLDFGSLARLMVRTTSPLSSSAAVAVIYFATTSVPAMISSTGKAVGVMAKFRPLLSIDSDYDGCSARPLLGHQALVRVVGFRMAGFMLSGSGIRACVLGNVELGWGGWGKVQFNVGG